MKHLPAAIQFMPLLVLAHAALVFSDLLAAAAAASDMMVQSPPELAAPLPGCSSSIIWCGNVEIPFPFVINQDCALPVAIASGNFIVTCNYSFNPPKPFIGNMEVLNISLVAGEMVVHSLIASICYNSTDTTDLNLELVTNLVPPYLVSPTRNEFTAIGCDTAAVMENNEKVLRYFTGCISYCSSVDDAAKDGDDCTGLGCCKVDIVANLITTKVYWGNANNIRPNYAWKYSPCSYAFVAQKNWYNFSRQDLVSTSFQSRVRNETIPLVLDWAIRDGGSCVNVSGNMEGPACVSNNSTCVNATNGVGYLCNCTTGYTGNPYVHDGCKNIIECQFSETYHCPSGSKCIDTDGGYKCHCNLFRRGKECRPIIPMAAVALLGTFVAIFFLVLLLWFNYKDRKRRVKMACFDKNGGEVLKQAAGIVIFTEVQLKKITNNYDTPIGKGAFGTVFLGTINNKERVAVKRSHFEGKKGGQFEGGEFVNEITFQFQNSHPNLVRLVGCCLETNIPVLVYEYISNGNLYNLLHVHKDKVLLLQTRLNIAIGSSEALAYMHSHGERDHIHGDVKAANILLNDNLMPKVSDFGSSRLLSTARYATDVAADMSYMDPIYMATHRFVPKSDVYSFGIVLLELITRETVRYGNDRSLPMDFIKSCKEKGNARELYDGDISSHDGDQCHYCGECLDKIGALAVRCLMYDVDERPTMADVVVELTQVANLVDKCKQLPNVSQHTVIHV